MRKECIFVSLDLSCHHNEHIPTGLVPQATGDPTRGPERRKGQWMVKAHTKRALRTAVVIRRQRNDPDGMTQNLK